MTWNNKPHPFTSRSINEAAFGGDDGLHARAVALAGSDDVRRLQRLPRRYDGSLEQLQAGRRSGLDLILQNALHAVIEWLRSGD